MSRRMQINPTTRPSKLCSTYARMRQSPFSASCNRGERLGRGDGDGDGSTGAANASGMHAPPLVCPPWARRARRCILAAISWPTRTIWGPCRGLLLPLLSPFRRSRTKRIERSRLNRELGRGEGKFREGSRVSSKEKVSYRSIPSG